MYIIIILIIFVLVFILIEYKSQQPTDKHSSIKILVRQAARWSAAAQQDKSPIIALLHANYGAGYLWALMDIATGKEIYDATKVNLSELKKKIVGIQDVATMKVSKVCPQFVGDIDKYLLKLSGDV